jgi:hypothetical protein
MGIEMMQEQEPEFEVPKTVLMSDYLKLVVENEELKKRVAKGDPKFKILKPRNNSLLLLRVPQSLPPDRVVDMLRHYQELLAAMGYTGIWAVPVYGEFADLKFVPEQVLNRLGYVKTPEPDKVEQTIP